MIVVVLGMRLIILPLCFFSGLPKLMIAEGSHWYLIPTVARAMGFAHRSQHTPGGLRRRRAFGFSTIHKGILHRMNQIELAEFDVDPVESAQARPQLARCWKTTSFSHIPRIVPHNRSNRHVNQLIPPSRRGEVLFLLRLTSSFVIK